MIPLFKNVSYLVKHAIHLAKLFAWETFFPFIYFYWFAHFNLLTKIFLYATF